MPLLIVVPSNCVPMVGKSGDSSPHNEFLFFNH